MNEYVYYKLFEKLFYEFILFEIELISNKIKTTKAVIFQLQDERWD